MTLNDHDVTYQETETTRNMYAFFWSNFILNLHKTGGIKLPRSLSGADLLLDLKQVLILAKPLFPHL